MKLRHAAAPLMALGLILGACSEKVDRSKSVDNMVKSIEDTGSKVDKDCLKDALAKHSDKELIDMDKRLKKGEFTEPDVQQFIAEIQACID